MRSKERFLTAMTGGQADRVPCTPDISNMVPCRLTGKPFWDIYLHQDPPLWQAYLDAVAYFGIDAWFFEGRLDFAYDAAGDWSSELVSQTGERIVQRTRIATPEGELECETTYCRADPPTTTEKLVKNFREQVHLLKYMLATPSSYGTDTAERQKAAVGEQHAFGTHVGYPGFQFWHTFFDDGLDSLAYAAVDSPDLLDQLYEWHEARTLAEIDMIIDSGLFDFVLLGGSGSLTMSSPALFDKYTFPCIQKICRRCREAGLPTMLHSCGKEKYLVERCAEESELDCVNPLEVEPMGDCDLATLKSAYGSEIALMGNLHTTDVMLKGTVADVKEAARKCIDDAAAGGGFILSTGDQCGRDTPDENIFALVETAETYGRYA